MFYWPQRKTDRIVERPRPIISMKKILNLIDTAGPGGAETVFINLCSAQKQAGHNPIAIIKSPGYVHDQLLDAGIDTRIIDSKGSFNFKLLKSLTRIIREERVDIIQSHLFGSAVYASLAGLITRKPVFATIHGLVDIDRRDRLIMPKLLLLRAGCSRIIAVSDQIHDMLKDLGPLSNQQIQTIYNGIDTARFERAPTGLLRQRLGLDKQPVIGALGNIRKPKNYPLAVQTLKKLHQMGIQAHLLIAGEGKGALLEQLKQTIAETKLEEFVHILGFVDDVRDFLSSLDILLISSSSEGHPLALTQAMINELPIVATPCGVEDILEQDHDALITEKHDAVELATLIGNILTQPELGQSLARNARTKALARYSLETMTGQYFNLYNSY
jgi:glycosyltransferase involved in cell wall biosynthesis